MLIENEERVALVSDDVVDALADGRRCLVLSQWKEQYTGRLMRVRENKSDVRVYDYADVPVPVLRAMHARRLSTYKRLGFTRERAPAAAPSPQLVVPILAA